MRAKGKITHWNGEKGFGFITPSTGAKQVFVHISAFTDGQRQPQVDQMVTFTLTADKSGRPRAEAVTRAGEPPPKRIRRGRGSGSSRNVLALIVIVVLAAAVGYSKYKKSQSDSYLPVKMAAPASPQYKCDGRTHCSQMSSCAEAKFFIQNCPSTKMDGDGDGVPCESQWCY